jgi:trk system potassium uptake protein TrkA
MDAVNEAFARLGTEFTGRTVQGDGLDIDMLRDARVSDAEVFIACTSGDNRNLTASQFAREVFGVPRVISRVSDPLRGEIYAEMGLKTISPTVLGAQLLYDGLVGSSSSVDCD